MKTLFIAVIIFVSSLVIAQDKTNYVGDWKRTVSIVMGFETSESTWPATLCIYEDGTYKEVRHEIGMSFKKEINTYTGIWEIDSEGKIKLFSNDVYEKNIAKYECYHYDKSKDRIYFDYAESNEGEIWTAKFMNIIKIYRKL